jgi:phosphopantetheinyl transferase
MTTGLRDVELLMGQLCRGRSLKAVVQTIRDPKDFSVTSKEAEAELAPEEFGLFRGIPSRKRASEFLAGRLAARRLLAEAPFHLSRADRVLVRDSSGAPKLKRDCGISVSISHSDRFAVAAASTLRIGIDLERNEARPACFEASFFSSGERQALDAVLEPLRQCVLNQLWCRKEAVCKVGRWGGSLVFRNLDCTTSFLKVEGQGIAIHSGVHGDFVAAIAQEIEHPRATRSMRGSAHAWPASGMDVQPTPLPFFERCLPNLPTLNQRFGV